jgi:hypothetical protein
VPGPNKAWELNPHTPLVCYSDCQRSAPMHARPVFTGRPNKGVYKISDRHDSENPVS